MHKKAIYYIFNFFSIIEPSQSLHQSIKPSIFSKKLCQVLPETPILKEKQHHKTYKKMPGEKNEDALLYRMSLYETGKSTEDKKIYQRLQQELKKILEKKYPEKFKNKNKVAKCTCIIF